MFRYIFLLVSLIVPRISQAQEIESSYVPLRPTAMGGAFTAISSDENAIWTNPAGIARIRKAWPRKRVHLVTVPNMIIGANKKGKSFLGDIRTFKAGSLVKIIQNIVDSGKYSVNDLIWLRLGISPEVFFDYNQNISGVFGLYSNSTLKLSFDKDVANSALVNTLDDFGSVMGVSFTNQSNRLNFGVQLRAVKRFSYEERTAVKTIGSFKEFKNKLLNEGNSLYGLPIDLGFIWTVADYWFPTIGFSIFNAPLSCQSEYMNVYEKKRQRVCGTKFSGKINNPESPFLLDPVDIRAGVSITPRLARKLAMRFAMDVHNISAQVGSQYYGLSGMDPMKRLHIGVEFFIGNPLQLEPITLQVGYNQGFTSYGLSLRFKKMNIGFASYTKDLSATDASKGDPRNLLSFSLEL